MESSDTGSLWARQAIRSLEQTFSVAGGTIHFFDRFPEEQGPYEQGINDINAISLTEAIRSLRADGAAALAIIGLCDDGDQSDEIVAAVDVERVPVVYVSWHEIQPPLAQVYYDNRFAGYQAAQHLLRKGYTQLLYLAPFRLGWLAERIEGARDAVRHAGLPADILRVYPDQPVHEGYNFDFADTWMFETARQLFVEENVLEMGADNLAENVLAGLSDEEPWGIIAPNDFTAYAILRAAAEQGKTMGVDYGLVGFDDDPRSYSLGLTTIRPPIEAMGEEAGRLLLRALHGERSGLQVRLRSQVIPRASTDPSPRASFPERQRALPVRRALQYSNRGMIR